MQVRGMWRNSGAGKTWVPAASALAPGGRRFLAIPPEKGAGSMNSGVAAWRTVVTAHQR